MTIYLDNAATSYPKPAGVSGKIMDFIQHIGANAGRGSHQRARWASEMVYEVRQKICGLFQGACPEQVVFTSNVTEALNMAIAGFLADGGHVITSAVEHNAVWRCVKRWEREKGAEISVIPCGIDGLADAGEVEGLIRPDTRLIAVTHASNVLGTIQPIREIGRIARSHGIPFLVDAAQTAGAYPVDMNEDCIDLLAFTGHKSLLGPTGTGGLVLHPDVVLPQWKVGGTGRDSQSFLHPDYLPDSLEAGTLNTWGLAGLGAALDFIRDTGVENIRRKEQVLTEYALGKLQSIPEVILYGPAEAAGRVGVISFNLGEVPAVEVAYVLDEVYDIALRAGLHCAPSAHRLIGTEERGTVRIGLGFFNQKGDVDRLGEALKEISCR